jgi:hypothetical protein
MCLSQHNAYGRSSSVAGLFAEGKQESALLQAPAVELRPSVGAGVPWANMAGVHLLRGGSVMERWESDAQFEVKANREVA